MKLRPTTKQLQATMTHNPNVQAPGLQEPSAPRASAGSTGASPEEKSVRQNDRYNHLQRRGRHSAAATMDEVLDLNVCLASAVQKAAVNIQKELGGPPPSVIPTVQIQRVGPGVLTSRASCGRVRRLVKKDKILNARGSGNARRLRERAGQHVDGRIK